MKTSGATFYVTAFATVLGAVLLWFAFEQGRMSAASDSPPIFSPGAQRGEPFVALPQSLPLNANKVALGNQLFNEVRLSGDATVSCAHCHRFDMGGVDRQPVSRGVGGAQGSANAPTVFNSGFNFRQFWDGRAETLEDQVDGPLLHPAEMAGSWDRTLDFLKSDAGYRLQFKALYPGGVTQQSVKDAIATFERSLITPNSRFDNYLRGDASALNDQEKAGLQLFKDIGCISCHQGVNLGGNMYQKLGVFEAYFSDQKRAKPGDLGRYNITRRESDRHFFKVPGLRNVALTGPYLHDGTAPTLEETVSIMARYQLGRETSPGEVAQLVAFLKTLTGEYQGRVLQ